MLEAFAHSRYMPHGMCYLWQPDLIGLHALSDGATALAYYSIPAAIVYFVRKRPDWEQGWVFALFALFIVSCGTTHALEVWTIWHPSYWTLGVVKAATALASLGTAAMLWAGMSTALRLPSPAQLRVANQSLAREIEERERAMHSLREEEARFRNAFEYAPIGMGLVAPEGRWLRVNRALCELLGYSGEELLARDAASITHPEDAGKDAALSRELLAGGRDAYIVEQRLLHKDGRVIRARVSVSLVRDRNREPLYFISQIEDITARHEAEGALKRLQQELERRVEERTAELEQANARLAREIEERHQAEQAVRRYAERLERVNAELEETGRRLAEQARTDELSGLANRRQLMERLGQAFHAAQRYGQPLCVLLLDIDHFKQVNDTHGHLVGDRVIAMVGALLKRELRDTDTAGRYGGEEFCIALTHVGLEQALGTAEKLRRHLAGQAVPDEKGAPLTITCSIGAAQWRPETRSLQALLAQTDKALYRAKAAGRNRVEAEEI